MKVAELIAKLQRMDPNADVLMPVSDRDGWEEYYDVEIAAHHPEGEPGVVIHYQTDAWNCAYPKPYRKPTEWDLQMRNSMRAMAKQWVEEHNKSVLEWAENRTKLGSTLRIRMPETK